MSAVVGHNWLMSPKPRKGTGTDQSASTTKPCDGTASTTVATVSAGQKLTTSWSTNHGGDHSL